MPFIEAKQQLPKKKLNTKDFYGIISESLNLTFVHETHNSEYPRYYYKYYTSNGSSDSSLVYSGKPLFGSNTTHAVINIPNYQTTYAGEYALEYNIHYFIGCKITGCDYHYENICEYAISYFLYMLISFLKISVSTLGEYYTIDTHSMITQNISTPTG